MPVLAVIGSRGWTNEDRLFSYLDSLLMRFEDLELVSGACPKGADYLAEVWAKKRGVPIMLYPADWSKGRGAGFERNGKIIKRADSIVAFWDGKSKGTVDSIEKAWRAGKKVLVASPHSPRVVQVRNHGDLADICEMNKAGWDWVPPA